VNLEKNVDRVHWIEIKLKHVEEK